MAATRVNRTTKTAPAPAAPATPQKDDQIPTFPAEADAPVYDGPVLFRIGKTEYRMRQGHTFASSLLWLNQVRRGSSVRDAEFTLIEDLVGAAALDALLATRPSGEEWTRVSKRAMDQLLGRFEEDSGN